MSHNKYMYCIAKEIKQITTWQIEKKKKKAKNKHTIQLEKRAT